MRIVNEIVTGDMTMIDDIILSQQLLANITHVDVTREFITEVMTEYLAGGSAPLQNGRIDGKLFKRRLERMLEEAITQKNPTFDHSIVVNVEWGLRNAGGFSCRIFVGISDFSLTQFGPHVVQVAPVWQ